MSIGHLVVLVTSITHFILFIVSLFVIGLNKKMTTWGRILRAVEIVVLPLFGPLIVILEVLSWKAGRESKVAEENKQQK